MVGCCDPFQGRNDPTVQGLLPQQSTTLEIYRMDQSRPLALCDQSKQHQPDHRAANHPPVFPPFQSPDQVMAYAILTVGIRWHVAGIRGGSGNGR